jgi:hypothetical protein
VDRLQRRASAVRRESNAPLLVWGFRIRKLGVSLNVGAGTGVGIAVAGTGVGVAAEGNLLRIRGTPNSLILLRVMHRTP